MLSDREKKEVHARIDRKIAVFESLAGEIIYAGLEPPYTPFLTLYDNSGELWKKQAWGMNAADVIEYVEANFGPLFVGFLHSHFNMTEH